MLNYAYKLALASQPANRSNNQFPKIYCAIDFSARSLKIATIGIGRRNDVEQKQKKKQNVLTTSSPP